MPEPPRAKAVASYDTVFGEVRLDSYRWLRDREDPEVIAYLRAENEYAQAVMAHTRELQESLFLEMRARIKESDLSVPVRIGPYFYYFRTEQGRQYAIYCRKRNRLWASEEVLFDENQAAAGREYFDVGLYRPSPDHRLLAYAVDTAGSEHYTLFFRTARAGRVEDSLAMVDNSLEWGADGRTVYYLGLDSTHRAYRLFRHRLGSPQESDRLLYQEDDPRFSLSLFKTRSQRYIVLHIASKTTTEQRLLEAGDPASPLRLWAARRPGTEYYLEHRGREFFILTNDQAENFKLLRSGLDPGAEVREFIPHCDSVMLEGVDAFKGHLAVYERHKGLKRIRIIDLEKGGQHYVGFAEPSYTFWRGGNTRYDSRTLRFTYTSFVTPPEVCDYHMDRRSRRVLKRQEVLGGYRPDDYRAERLLVPVSEGIRVPVSLVYRRDLFRGDGSNPLLLSGYGAYGASSDPYFSSSRISLLDRGFVYAVAQVRGGGELGRRWYDQGRLLNKQNTFSDFVRCAEWLAAEGYSRPRRMAAIGGSAGGLLMGAVCNQRPDLFWGVVARVPFVDVVNTMRDPTIPLTTAEYEEWGDPADSNQYRYMRAYSPYDNVRRQEYPHLLITAGLNDPRVGFWEPAKWAAKLRATKSGSQRLILKTNLGAGHGGMSGRFDYLREEAFEYAFLLDLMGISR
jgi:oligopeptidase B